MKLWVVMHVSILVSILHMAPESTSKFVKSRGVDAGRGSIVGAEIEMFAAGAEAMEFVSGGSWVFCLSCRKPSVRRS